MEAIRKFEIRNSKFETNPKIQIIKFPKRCFQFLSMRCFLISSTPHLPIPLSPHFFSLISPSPYLLTSFPLSPYHPINAPLSPDSRNSLFEKCAQFEPVWRCKPQEGSPRHPIPYIKVETFSPFNLFLHLIRKVRVAENDDLKPL